MYDRIRAKIDEALLIDVVKRIRNRWISHIPKSNPYLRQIQIGAVDSGYNYMEFRGYALYIVNASMVAIGPTGDSVDGIVDVDVSSSTVLEYELSLLSIAMEIEAIEKLVAKTDLVLVDGSLLAKFFKLLRARDEVLELLLEKKISIKDMLNRLLTLLALYQRKIVFIAKNSNSKDLLNLVKGDVYYLERYTDGEPGFSRPQPLSESRAKGSQALAHTFRSICKEITGIGLDLVYTYIRFQPFSRVYRVEFACEDIQGVEDYIRSFMNMLEPYIFNGYPYPLMLADYMARVTGSDVERIATVLGIAVDPYAREPLR